VTDTSAERAGLVSEGADARGNDCILQNPVITKSCVNAVDASSCTADNPDEVLEGVEQWAMIVEYPGTGLGLRCEEVIRKKMLPSKSQSSHLEVSCNDAGLCTSSQSCQVACRYVRPEQPQQESPGNENAPNACSGASWGACLETCHQAKVSGTFMSDGRCHEDQSKREERECHTEYCGISDPCLIPFVVHVILAFRGVDHSMWNKEAESIVIDAFSDSVKNRKHTQIFEPSDVELLMVSPWHQEVLDDFSSTTTGEMSELLGTKIVMEVHMYNENAIVPNGSMEEGSHRNDLVGDLSQKMSTMLRSKMNSRQHSECKSSDIFELAQKAHEIHFVLADDDFMRNLGESLKKHPNVDQQTPSAFSPMLTENRFVEESIVFSSWTIKTEVGGGSVYDHQLDPYPGAIHFVKVTPAYFGFLNFSTTAYLVLPLLVFVYIAKRRRSSQENENRFLSLNPATVTFCAKPFQIVKRNLRGSNSFLGLRSKSKNNPVMTTDDSFDHGPVPERDTEHFPALIGRGSRSRLSDIINN